MSRTPKTLIERVARQCSVEREHLLDILAHYTPESCIEPCLVWGGFFVGWSPVMRIGQTTTPVRRVMHELATGEPTPNHVRLENGCGTDFCIHPSHSRQKIVSILTLDTVDEIIEVQADNVEECMDAILSRDRPWDIPALALEWDYGLDMMLEAERNIMEQGL